MTDILSTADLFCGAGGLSSGLEDACQSAGIKLSIVAVNHWEIAIKTHSLNHPDAQHYCASIDQLDPRNTTDRLDVLVAAPECIFHSKARGGRPINDQRRASAFHVLRWMELFLPHSVLIENVPEFRDWAPLGSNGLPLKSKRGETFEAFLGMMRSLGYKVEHQILNCADYGDVTTRQRLFIIARRGNRKIRFPEPTHSKTGATDMFGGERLPWRAAKEIIDWGMIGESIFNRKKPLAPNTMKRIEAGLRKYGKKAFVIQQQSGGAPRLVDLPLPTIAGTGSQMLIQPFIVRMNGGDDGYTRMGTTDEPLATVTAHPTHTLVEPFIISRAHKGGNGSYVYSSDRPISTLTTQDELALVQPFIAQYHGSSYEGGERVRSVDSPLNTITTSNPIALIQPFIIGYHKSGENIHSIDDPFATMTTKDRYAIIIPGVGEFDLDIRIRMLEPKEMAAAHGLQDYDWSGTTRTDQKRMIGNSVPRRTAAALCSKILE